MKYGFKKMLYFGVVIIALIYLNSCSKSSPSPAPTAPDPCAGKTIVITATANASTGCTTAGSINVSASGSTGFTFKLNSGGTYQASGIFSNLSPAVYTVFVKDGAGCEKSTSVTVTAGAAGPLFTQLRSLMTAKCQPCHNNTIQNGGMNFAVDCNMVANQARIKIRAVDEGTMPSGGPALTPGEKAIITNWINAGGRLTD
ncbi:MAG TPA: hypothetical protein VLR49_01145 [Ferruginibacter sp.]|nr:hypothetical protein [Ferruginibacter sp.]